MATTFAKLNLSTTSPDPVEITIQDGSHADVTVKVKQYLPLKEKIALVNQVMKAAYDEDTNTVHHVSLEVAGSVYIVDAYSDITFTDVQKEKNIDKTYDALELSGVSSSVINAIPENEYSYVLSILEESAKRFNEYQMSAAGVMKNVSQNYSNTEIDMNEIMSSVSDPEQMAIVKQMMALQQENLGQRQIREEAIQTMQSV